MPEPWKSRRQRRQEARELAKQLMHSTAVKPPTAKLDVGWFLATCMALGLLLIGPKIGRVITVVVLVAMVLCLVRPIWQFRLVQGAPSNPKKTWRFAGIMSIAVVSVALFGVYVWPSIKRHTLTAKERASFENALKLQNADALEVQIACPSADEKTCTYADQFINLVGKSGWKVEPYVSRVTLTRAQDGITIYRRAGNKDYSLKHWDAGGYLEITEPHLLAVQSAFQSIHIEPGSGTNPDLLDNVMMIYFGPEKENEAEPTNLTRSTEWVKGDRKSLPPIQPQ